MIPVATTQLNHPYISTGRCFDGRICPSTLLQGGHSPIFLGIANNTTSTISLIANQQTCFCRDHIPSSSPNKNAPQPKKKHHPTQDTRFFLLNMDTIIPLPKKSSLNFKRPYSHSFPKTFLLGDLSHQFWTSKKSSLPPKKNTPPTQAICPLQEFINPSELKAHTQLLSLREVGRTMGSSAPRVGRL